MKISVITIIDNVNIGTYLQSFALAQVLEKWGHKVEYIDYSRPSQDVKSLFWASFTKITPWHWPSYWKGLIGRAIILRRQRTIIKQYLTPQHYVGYSSIVKDPPIADIYMTGSDQVWNSVHNRGIDKTFYMAYAPLGAQKIAYAASIGMADFPEEEREETKMLLESYKAISVRELSAIKVLQNLGITSNKIKLVLDPTFLLNRIEWEKIASPRSLSSPYLLCYYVSNEKFDEINYVAQYIAKKRNLKVALLGIGNKKTINCDIFYKNTSPSDFVALFLGASFTVVNSFHGTAFSINFEKDFVSIMPNRFTSRVDGLLHLCGLEDRKYYSGETNLETYLSSIDYSKVTPIIGDKRKESMEFLTRQCGL